MTADGPGGVALITGVTGQDGHYLSRQLLDKGFEVHGVVSADGRGRGVADDVRRHTADLRDARVIGTVIDRVQPDVVFHLAAVSSVAASWDAPLASTEVNAVSTVAVLDGCLRTQERTGKKITVVNASSCEIFAGAMNSPQSEDTPVRPISPYGVSKAMGHMMCQVYRARGLEASNAILYNHESPLRPDRFVTRKITRAVAAIAAGRQDRLVLGDLRINRDWGWAPDYVDAMCRMALYGKGDDFVIATGVAHSIADFVKTAFSVAGVTDWQDRVQSDSTLLRPADRAEMVGDATKAAAILDWRFTMSFTEIVEAMVISDSGQEQSR
jgi:GDPmannose 4,6-dehydratase